MKYGNILGVFLCFFLASPVQADQKLNVIASFSIIGDMVAQVGGDNINLKVLVKADGDVHEYEPTPADAGALAKADIVFINGLGLEGWVERLVKSADYKGQIITLTDKVVTLPHDPHAWQNPQIAILYVEAITEALVKADPLHAAFYQQNRENYSRQLEALDKWTRAEIAKVPASQRKVISTHDAFQYFAREYGIAFIAPLGISTDSQPSAADLARITDQIRQSNIRAVFLENMTDSRLIRQLEKDTGIAIGGTLYSDSLSPAEPAAHYIDMFRHNVNVLVVAMQK